MTVRIVSRHQHTDNASDCNGWKAALAGMAMSNNVISMRAFAAAVLFLLASCSQESTAPNCSPMRSGWLRPEDGVPELAIVDELHVASSGATNWNHEEVSDKRLVENLRAVGHMEPRPFILLTYDVGAACNRIEAIRDSLENALHCQEGQCNEGGLPAPSPCDKACVTRLDQKKLQSLFAAFDTNGDKSVSRAEWRRVRSVFDPAEGPDLDALEAKADTVFKAVDTDKDGRLNLSEFAELNKQYLRLPASKLTAKLRTLK
jgi:hypothetical protein